LDQQASVGSLLILSAKDKIKYITSINGADLFLRREADEPSFYRDQITIAQSKIGIGLPLDYFEFYASFDVAHPLITYLDLPEGFGGWAFCKADNTPVLLFEYFIEHNEILEHWECVNQYDQEEYHWDILKIAQTPWQGGFYLGFGEENFGKVYWVRTEFIPEDFRLADLSEKHRDGIRLVANSFTEFLNGLRYFLGESPEY